MLKNGSKIYNQVKIKDREVNGKKIFEKFDDVYLIGLNR
jgi:hypothetical protein